MFCLSSPHFNLERSLNEKTTTSNWKTLPSPWQHFNFLAEHQSKLFTCSMYLFVCGFSRNYWHHWEEKPWVSFFFLAAQERPRDPNTLLLFCKKLLLCMVYLIWFIKGDSKLSPLPVQASGLSRDKRWVVLSDRLLPGLRYRAFLFYSPSKLVTAKRFPWWKISFNIYFLPDTLLFFYWVECALFQSRFSCIPLYNLPPLFWVINSCQVPVTVCWAQWITVWGLTPCPPSKIKTMQTSSSA